MKYIVFIGDGMADEPLKKLGNKTPLEKARTPHLNFLVKNGSSGMVRNVPKGLIPGSDVAIMSIMGYDPQKYYAGRGPLEAEAMGLKMAKGDMVFRCNLVRVENGKMKDFTAGHIKTEEARKVIHFLDHKLGNEKIKFYPGVGYRHLLIYKKGPNQLKTTAPHDITNQSIESYLPQGAGAEKIRSLMQESVLLLNNYPSYANMIWLWGQGQKTHLPSFKKRFGLKGAMITAVDLLKGMAKALGMEFIPVQGATGFLDTNYKGKAEAALKALEKYDIVFVHVEAPDEAGHMGKLNLKIRAIEDFDKKVVGHVLKQAPKNLRVLVLPDHPTPIAKMTHTEDPVPFVMWGEGIKPGKAQFFSEKAISRWNSKVLCGHDLIKEFISK